MQYRISEEDGKILIKDLKSDDTYAQINEDARLIFYGDFPEQKCDEIKAFLESQCIHLDENGYAYRLTY